VRLNRLDLNLLVALDALLTERSITVAAERIFLSQPATSGALARLRDYFDDALLVRVGSKMQPTPLGESLAEPVHNILMQIQATVERGLEFEPANCERKFKFYVGDYAATIFMSHLAQRVRKEAPGIKMEFFMPTNKPGEELERGHIDFMLLPEVTLHEDHPVRSLFTEQFVCLACQQNDAVNEQMSVETFMELGHVSVQFGSHRVPGQDQLLLKSEHGLAPRIEIITSTFNSIPQFLVGTPRIATVYSHLAEHWKKFLPLKTVPVPVPLPNVAWGLQWHKYRDLDPALKWLKEQAVITAQSHFGDTISNTTKAN